MDGRGDKLLDEAIDVVERARAAREQPLAKIAEQTAVVARKGDEQREEDPDERDSEGEGVIAITSGQAQSDPEVLADNLCQAGLASASKKGVLADGHEHHLRALALPLGGLLCSL